MAKVYKVEATRYTRGEARTYSQVGTLVELVKAYSYSLEVGASWQHEQGNKKINQNPKSIKVLVKNLYNAKNNAAANGYSGYTYAEAQITPEDMENYNLK